MEAISQIASEPALLAARAAHLKAVEAIDVALSLLRQFNPSHNPVEYADLPPRVALQRFLERQGGSASKQEALEALIARGCNLGERAAANLSTVITTNRDRFVTRGETVYLVRKSIQRAA